MKLYTINGQRVILHEGELYGKIDTDEPVSTPPMLEGRKKRKTPVEEADEPAEEELEALQPVIDEEDKHEPLSPKGKRLSPEVRNEIMKRIDAGVQPREIMEEFKISPGTVSNIKQAMKKMVPSNSSPFVQAERKLIPRTNYICDIGHRFTSNLPIGKAMCLSCKSKILKVAQEAPVFEE